MVHDLALVLPGQSARRLSGAFGLSHALTDYFVTDTVVPLASPRDCEPGPGNLILVQLTAEFSIESGKLVIAESEEPLTIYLNDQFLTPQVAPLGGAGGAAATAPSSTPSGPAAAPLVYGNYGFYTENSYERTYGRMYCYELTPNDINGEAQLGMLPSAALDRDADVAGLVYGAGGQLFAREAKGEGTSERLVGSYAATVQRMCHMLRTNGYILMQDTGSGFRVLWVSSTGNQANVYPHLDIESLTGVMDDLVVGKFTTWQLVPLASDSFDRADNADPNADGGTDGAATEEFGGLGLQWVSQGAWEIKSNRLLMTASAGNGSCVVDSGAADGIVMGTVQVEVGAGVAGLVVRHAAGSGGVVAGVSSGGGHQLFDWDGATTLTPVATGSGSISVGTDYELAVYVEGDSIVSYLDGGDRIVYPGTPPAGATEQGAFGNDVGHKVDDFVVFPRLVTNLPYPTPGP